MNARYRYAVFCLLVILSLGACGKSEPETAPAAPSATSAPAAPVDPATAAVVAGSVKLEGAVPKGRSISMAAEPACAKEHGGKPVVSADVVTGDGGALANVVIYVKEGLGNRAFETPRESVVIDQKGCLYSPRVVAVQTGQKLEVRNSDQTTHNIHPLPALNTEWNKSQPAGAPPIVESFAREELPPIPVKCNVHPWMKSYIAVFKHPYHAITSKDGKFELKNLPPGEYLIEAWHEKLGSAQEKVTVGAKETKSISFTFKAPAGD